jgi:hypothetical protein
VSTKDAVDIWSYPDSGKFGLMAGVPDGSTEGSFSTRYCPDGASIDYWDGES